MRGLTAMEFLGWEAYARVEPFNVDVEARADARAASIVQVLQNVNRGKGQRAWTLQDAMLNFDKVEENSNKGAKRYDPQTQEEMLSVLKALSIMQNTIDAQETPEAKD